MSDLKICLADGFFMRVTFVAMEFAGVVRKFRFALGRRPGAAPI
jgi:hypothetical protein